MMVEQLTRPQSNQRGIETLAPTGPLADPTGLNRTSVGLKLRKQKPGARGVPPPQSNQRGIETGHLHRLREARAAPQSNQRGIETRDAASRPGPAGRLNRTSVGLKPRPRAGGSGRDAAPQSNQRGIETKRIHGGPRIRTAASIEPAWD